MAKKAAKGMHGKSDRKSRGRTTISGSLPGPTKDTGPSPTEPHVPQEVRREANRPITPGAGKHRGDRRDMNKVYTGNARHAARGNNPRVDVSTRKR